MSFLRGGAATPTSSADESEWRVVRITGLVFTSLCIAASCGALIKMCLKCCCQRRVGLSRQQGGVDDQTTTTRITRLVERVVGAILLLDMLANVVTFAYCYLHHGPIVFLRGEIEEPTKLGMISYFHWRESFGAALLYFHVVLGHICCDWIVYKFSVMRLERRYRIDMLLLFGILGSTSLFIVMEVLRLYLGALGLLIGLLLYDGVIMPAGLIYTTVVFYKTARALQSGASADTFFAERYARLRTRILLMVSICQIVGLGATLFDVILWANLWANQSNGLRLSAALLGLLTWRLVALLDAVVLGGIFERWDFGCFHKPKSLEACRESSSTAGCSLSQIPDLVAVGNAVLARTVERQEAKVFASTWNMGSLKQLWTPQQTLECWIPKHGYDIYAVAVQECVNLAELREEISIYLGAAFAVHTVEIRDAKVLQGNIALLLYYREVDAASGALFIYEGPQTTLRTGVDLGIARAGNKGMCGVSLRYHDATLAFIAAHFHSDSKGQTRICQRYKDAQDMLRGLSLDWDMDLDTHLQHHHTFLLGDLNFRSDGQPEEVLSLVARAATEERNSSKWKGASNWRRRTYQTAIMQCGKPTDATTTHDTAARGERMDDDLTSGDRGGAASPDRSKIVTPGDDSAPPASDQHNPWWWVPEYDQLLQAVREEQALEGFREGPICFPPSYRYRRKGEGPGDFTDYNRLSGAYAWQVVKPGAAKRVTYRTPSYCDRVLVHSMPDKKELLEIRGYEMCDDVRGSDHLPVSAAMSLQVDKTVLGFTCLSGQSRASADSQGALTTSSSSADSGLPRLSSDDSSATDALSSPLIMLVSIEIRNVTFDLLDPKAEVGELCLVYPLLSEDPLAFRRKALALDSLFPALALVPPPLPALTGHPRPAEQPVFSGRSSSASHTDDEGSQSTNTNTSSSNDSKEQHHQKQGTGGGTSSGKGGSACPSATEGDLSVLLSYVKQVNWKEKGWSYARRFKTQVLAHTLFSEHAALKVRNVTTGKRLGHAVFSVHALLTPLSSQPTEITVPLTLGATPVGTITFEIKVEQRQPPPGIVLPQPSSSSGLLAVQHQKKHQPRPSSSSSSSSSSKAERLSVVIDSKRQARGGAAMRSGGAPAALSPVPDAAPVLQGGGSEHRGDDSDDGVEQQ